MRMGPLDEVCGRDEEGATGVWEERRKGHSMGCVGGMRKGPLVMGKGLLDLYLSPAML